MPVIPYLEVGMRFYGPAVDKTAAAELYNASFNFVAGILHVCCNQKTQLLSIRPAESAPKEYRPPNGTPAMSHDTQSEPSHACELTWRFLRRRLG